MIILVLRTDKPEAEIGLYNEEKMLVSESWQAHRQLSEKIHIKILEILKKQKLDWKDIEGIVFYGGPGSFTGLRIGASVANSLSASLDIPLAQTTGERWAEKGIKMLLSGNTQIAQPEYGAEPRVTKPVK